MRHLIGIEDLADDELTWLRRRSSEEVKLVARRPPLVALAFAQQSLRTRTGFAVAAMRLGGGFVDVSEQFRRPGTTAAEPLRDVVRVVSGMADVLVYRGPGEIEGLTAASVAPVINGGSLDAHPTQAVIDLVSIERFAGPIGDLSVGICGDLSSRTARSLIRLLGRVIPRRLRLMGPTNRPGAEVELTPELASHVEWCEALVPDDLDVLHLPGLPEGTGEGRLDDAGRRPFHLSSQMLARLPPHAIVLSPMPVIDEIDDGARADRRVRMFDAIDLSVAVRADLLELCLSWRER